MEWPVAVPLDDSIRHALASPHPGILRAATRKHQPARNEANTLSRAQREPSMPRVSRRRNPVA
jgi:hypothetical protein